MAATPGDLQAVLAAGAELALSTGTRMVEPLAYAAATPELPHDRWFAALHGLKEDGLIQLATAASGPPQVVLVALTNAGLLHHVRATRPDLDDLSRRLAAATTEAVGNGPVPLADRLGEPALLVEVLLDDLVDQRRLTYSKAPGRRFRIHRVISPPP